jgi:hypothetical protein
VNRFLLLLLLVVPPAWLRGDGPAPLSIPELTARAEWIVHGRVLSKTCQRDAAGRIYTAVELRIEEVWKGADLAAGQLLRVVHSGGTLGEERVAVSGQVAYEVNEEVVAFLRRNPRGEGVTIGLAQGKFRLEPDAATGTTLARPASAQLLATRDAPELNAASLASPGMASAKPSDGSVEWAGGCHECLTLGELKQRVRASLRPQ